MENVNVNPILVPLTPNFFFFFRIQPFQCVGIPGSWGYSCDLPHNGAGVFVRNRLREDAAEEVDSRIRSWIRWVAEASRHR